MKTVVKDFHDIREEIAIKWNKKSWDELMHYARNDQQMQDDIHYEVTELYAQQSCQLTFNKILSEITPHVEQLDGHAYYAILNSFLNTDPVLP